MLLTTLKNFKEMGIQEGSMSGTDEKLTADLMKYIQKGGSLEMFINLL